VLKTGVIEFPTSHCILVEPKRAHGYSADNLPDLPVLPETLLALELQLQDYAVDLRAFTEVVLTDLGATLQILRMAARESETGEDQHIRIEDCICDFGPAACFEVLAKGAMMRNLQRHSISKIWDHARHIAQNAKHLAEAIPSAITPDQAYMAGLLHAIGSLPSILGWAWSEASHDYAATALKLADRWSLPGYLRDFFCEMLMPGFNPQWSEVMAEAHRLADVQADRCTMIDAAIRPSA